MGDFGKRLFEPSDLFGEFPLAAQQAEQHRKQAVGCVFLLWLLSFRQAKESNSPSGEKDHSYSVIRGLFGSTTYSGSKR
jgi:hypothetical protein